MFCRKCGKKLDESARFCSECGCSVSDVPFKAARSGRKAGIIIAVGAVVLCFCLFVFTRIKGGDEANIIGTDGIEASGAVEGESSGSKTGGAAGSVKPQEGLADCESYTIGETSSVSQWILENWGVDSLGQCDFIEIFAWQMEEMHLVVKKPGINLDYAVFSLDDDGSDVGILGRYEFVELVSGIYCGTDDKGIDFYRMYMNTRGTDWGIFALNEMGKIEAIFKDTCFYNVLYGGNGRQERIEGGRMTADGRAMLMGIYSGLVPSSSAFPLENIDGVLSYKYDSVTNRIETVHIGLYEEDVNQDMRNKSSIEGECSFRYLELADRVSLEGVLCHLTRHDRIPCDSSTGEGEDVVHEEEHTAWINYNRDAFGNLISFEIGFDAAGSSGDSEDQAVDGSSGASGAQAANGVMTYAEYDAAAPDSRVVIEAYVQAKQSWWENQATVYAQDKDGAYFLYNMACSEEDYARLITGTKIKVTGYKTEWAGEAEIIDAAFEIMDGNYVASAMDVTFLMGTDDLIRHQNKFVSFKGMTVEDAGNGSAFMYDWDGSGQEGSDLYFNASINGATYTFVVESYLCGADTGVYQAVKALEIGQTVDMEGFLYWYYGANPHITSVCLSASDR